MADCFGSHFILNGRLMPATMFDDSLIYEGQSVYEVLRLKNGIPCFYNDHLLRLKRSISLGVKNDLWDLRKLKSDISLLTDTEKHEEINLKIVCNLNNYKANCLVYYIKSQYPSPAQYSEGVKGILFTATRYEPVSKIIHRELREKIFKRLHDEDAYEALLVNESGQITEGSRTNIFFISEDHLITAPDECVLGGITRKHILDICRQKRIEVKFECPDAGSINKFSLVFMTGTSPVVLPFNSIDNLTFNVSNPLISMLREEFMIRAEHSLNEFLSL